LSKENKPHRSKIGGQALYEGVMMRGSGREAMAVRKKDGSIHIETKDVPANKWYQKTPFIRGVFNFILQMKNGYKYLMKSMEISGFLDEDDEAAPAGVPASPDVETAQPIEISETIDTPPETIDTPPEASDTPSETPQTPEKKSSKTAETLIGVFGMIGGVALAIFLFMFVPARSFTLVNNAVEADMVGYRSLIEGIIRIFLFVIYMWAISLMKEIRITYQYHGAEHKTIAAYEAGEKLNPEDVTNVVKYKRFHPRCGTSFIFLVLAISIILYSILPINSENIAAYFGVAMIWADVIRTAFKIMLMPFLVAITYEIIKLAGRYDRNIFMRIISAPGLGLQRLTTKEPSERQLEVAISAMLPVIPENKEEDRW